MSGDLAFAEIYTTLSAIASPDVTFLGAAREGAQAGALQAVRAAVRTADPVTTAVAAVPLVLASLVACYLPARRAARTDPLKAMRDAG